MWLTEGGGGRGWGSNHPHTKFRSFDKAEPNSQFLGKYIHSNLIRIRVSLICKLSGTCYKGATAPRSPFCLPSVLNWICWTPPSPPPPNKIPGYASVFHTEICAVHSGNPIDSSVYLPTPRWHHLNTQQNWQKNWQTWWETCVVPENIQFSFSRSFLHSYNCTV
jgi:hypothetical protein